MVKNNIRLELHGVTVIIHMVALGGRVLYGGPSLPTCWGRRDLVSLISDSGGGITHLHGGQAES